ncbi:MAG: thioredoxin family protein [Candidatus Kariarchaeaceae archaeon]
MTKGKHIKIFSDDCTDCLEHIDNVSVGKCAGCLLEIFPFESEVKSVREQIDKYIIIQHPTTIIDDEIKVVGMPQFYWQCGDEFYSKLKHDYPLKY